MVNLTVGLVTRHFTNRAGGWDPAMLDIAQDHALCHLAESGMFDLGLVFKGGTALRKCRAGAKGRFSTDLDFCAPDPGLAALVLETLDGQHCHGFTFTLNHCDPDAGRAGLTVTAPLTRRPPHAPGVINIASKIEMSARAPWLGVDRLPLLRSPVHVALGHASPTVPVLTVTESVAEKLARYSRVGLARDLYDLCWYGRECLLAEPAIRRTWLAKVYGDVVVDRRWRKTFDASTTLHQRPASAIDEESIGFLTYPADIPSWEREFRTRYAFLADLDHEDHRWARCDPRDRYRFEALGPHRPE